MRLARLLLLALLAGCAHHNATIPLNEHGLAVVGSSSLHQRLVAANPGKDMVDLETHVPGVKLDIRYATDDNFMKRRLYDAPRAFLRRPAADALRSVQEELRTRGLGLKVFDAYRPYTITKRMWEAIRNPDYVADPAKGSRHNRGCAVDVSLISLADGNELPMPTGYDAFEPAAAHTFEALPSEAKANRALLKEVMERHGFDAFASEWWHYDFRGWENYELLDLPFEGL
jgi:zinc D-Ala-D-Ala dipeptidase